MIKSLKGPGGETAFNAVLFLILALAFLYFGGVQKNSFLFANGAVLLLIAGGLWFRRNWARLLALSYTAIWVLLFAVLLVLRGFSWRDFLPIIAGAFMFWDLLKTRFPSNAESDDADTKLISIVLLLKEPKKLDLQTVRQMVLRAWGISLGQDREANEWIAEVGPSFGMKTRFGTYALHVAPHPYVDDQDNAADEILDLRLANIIRDHKAWYAVDLMEFGDRIPAPEQAYPYIGQLLAELVDDNCLGVYCPETQRLNPNTPELVEKLRGPNPLADLTEPASLPVVRIDDDDPQMQAAVGEARQRWPEFLQAFNSGQGENFAVKAPVSSGDRTEFIWIEVTSISAETISGTLGNDPANLPGLQLGSTVSVPLKDLNDWVYLTGEEMHGGFTMKVLQDAMQKKP